MKISMEEHKKVKIGLSYDSAVHISNGYPYANDISVLIYLLQHYSLYNQVKEANYSLWIKFFKIFIHTIECYIEI